jgi:acetyl-CoA carboxylase biotin carboxyl carrier protein
MPAPKGPDAKDGSSESSAIDAKLVRKLADILNATGLTEIEVEQGALRIRVAKQGMVMSAAPIAAAPVYAPQAAPAPAAAPIPATPAVPAAAKGDPIKSPMVGTVYLRPQPGADPFVKVGDKVAAGQTLLIVEAMKTMNPIPAPRAGVIAAIVVGDADPVEYGEVLVVLE